MSPKKIVRSITMILVAFLTVAIASAMALIMKFLAITAWIDYLFRVNLAVFWVAMITSRVGFATLWGLIDYIVVSKLRKGGWFWFAPEPRSYRQDEPGEDYSSLVFILAVGACFAFVVAEMIIHFFTPETPPFWFWNFGG